MTNSAENNRPQGERFTRVRALIADPTTSRRRPTSINNYFTDPKVTLGVTVLEARGGGYFDVISTTDPDCEGKVTVPEMPRGSTTLGTRLRRTFETNGSKVTKIVNEGKLTSVIITTPQHKLR